MFSYLKKKSSINPDKTSGMIFIRNYKVPFLEPLRFWEAVIKYGTSVKYLYFDIKLHLKQHIRIQQLKTYALPRTCRRVMGRN